MTEEEARARVEAIVGSAAMPRLERLVAMVIDENGRQNLVARSTEATIWCRHVLDSAQLLRWAAPDGDWIDIGTGGGFPGLAVAAVVDRPFVLVEPRRRRADFLRETAMALGLGHVRVESTKIEAVAHVATTISARAVASIEKLLQASIHCATPSTRWLLPRGVFSNEECVALGADERIMFHVEQSLSDPGSSIVIIEQRPR